MISRTTSKFWKLYKQLDSKTQAQSRSAYALFAKNPGHPSLKFKKVHANRPIYSARINLDFRVVGILEKNEIVWFWVGPHDIYDKLIARL